MQCLTAPSISFAACLRLWALLLDHWAGSSHWPSALRRREHAAFWFRSARSASPPHRSSLKGRPASNKGPPVSDGALTTSTRACSMMGPNQCLDFNQLPSMTERFQSRSKVTKQRSAGRTPFHLGGSAIVCPARRVYCHADFDAHFRVRLPRKLCHRRPSRADCSQVPSNTIPTLRLESDLPENSGRLARYVVRHACNFRPARAPQKVGRAY